MTTLLPPAIADCFRQYRGAGDTGKWQLGDRIEEIYTELAGRVTLTALYKSAALETEQSRAEVRQLHETARAFDTSLRAEFDDVLCWAHYRVLRYIDDRARKQAYLAWCVESADAYGGRPAPASVLAKKVLHDLGLEPPAATFGELLARAVTAIERARDADDCPADKRDKLADILTRLEAL